MEEALTLLKNAADIQEFLKLTRTALRVIQNILNDPNTTKFRTVRAESKYVQKPGVSLLLEAIGFKLKGEEYIFNHECDHSLLEKKAQIVTSRRATNSVMGWDVPSSSLKFSLVQDKGRFGDIFIGRMDNQDVMVKIVHPDCNKEAKCAFDRELDILSKVSHPNIVQLLAVTLTSEPISLILEYIPCCLLDMLHSSEVLESEVLKYGEQLASAMNYLHLTNVLHCDLAARNLLLASDGKLLLSEFGSSRWDGTDSCHLLPSARDSLNVRWMPPETTKDLIFTKHSDIWSFGVVLYELLTGGSVPYATLSNTEVQAKVEEGYRLLQPQGCPEDLYHLMKLCWAQRPTDRPHFSEILKTHLEPMISSEADARPPSTPTEDEDHKSLHLKLNKKLKVKEPSYQSIISKGGGLLRIYTALVSPFQHRVVVVCSRKSSVGDVVATALAKCGKQDQDAKNHRMVLVSGPASGSPAHYLDPEDKILSVKSGALPTAMFVLCVYMPSQAPLEIIDSIRQNPAYDLAFSSTTRGYLVRREGNQGQRNWCVLDGSTLLCYKQEEDEGVKEFESFLDFKGCSVEVSTKGKSHIFKVETSDKDRYSFLATSKDNMLEWVESISASKTLDPSPLLLHNSGGPVIQTGFMDCQEFAYDSSDGSTSIPLKQRKLGTNVDFAGTYAAIDYGKHWTVLRSSGLVQCLVKGRPETLFNLATCHRVRVDNPQKMKEGEDYYIEIENPDSKFVMKADLPTEHSDWVLAIEQILKKLDHTSLLQGHRKRESGYVALKRLLLTGGGQAAGQGSQLYCFPRVFDDMEDIYEPPNPPPPKERSGPRSELLQKQDNIMPLPPRDYLPPPLPPRNNVPPPLPPKGSSTSFQRPSSIVSSESCSDPDDDYVMMQSTTPRSSFSASPLGTPLPPHTHSRNATKSPSQPITIPHRRTSKRSALLRTDLESTNSSPSIASSLKSLQEGVCMDSHKHSISRSSSIHSNQSLNFSSNNMIHLASMSIVGSVHNGRKLSSGYASPIPSPSQGLKRSQSHSHRFNSNVCGGSSVRGTTMTSLHLDDSSKSDGLTMAETIKLQQFCGNQTELRNNKHPISKAGSIPQKQNSYTSEGYESNHSSMEDLDLLPVGWERGYCQSNSRYFYFNSYTGASSWSLQEVLMQNMEHSGKPGIGWKVARTEDDRIYYYHEQTRHATWDVQETWR